MRVPDKHHARIRCRKSFCRRVLVGNILEVLLRSSMHEQEIRKPQLIWQRIEPRQTLFVDNALRPFDRGSSEIIEIIQTETIDSGEIVIAEHGGVHAFPDYTNTLVRVRTIPHRVAEAQELVVRAHELQCTLE